MQTFNAIGPCGWLFLGAFAVIFIKVECAFQALRWRQWREWVPDALILLGGAWQSLQVLSGSAINLATAMLATGVALLMHKARPIKRGAT